MYPDDGQIERNIAGLSLHFFSRRKISALSLISKLAAGYFFS
jgi:hypothetical protein